MGFTLVCSLRTLANSEEPDFFVDKLLSDLGLHCLHIRTLGIFIHLIYNIRWVLFRLVTAPNLQTI